MGIVWLVHIFGLLHSSEHVLCCSVLIINIKAYFSSYWEDTGWKCSKFPSLGHRAGLLAFIFFLWKLMIAMFLSLLLLINDIYLKTNIYAVKFCLYFMQEIIRPVENPIKKTGHIQILYGNLAPNGSVAKITGKEGLYFSGATYVLLLGCYSWSAMLYNSNLKFGILYCKNIYHKTVLQALHLSLKERNLCLQLSQRILRVLRYVF